MFILFLSVSSDSFRQCKVTAIFFRFQEKTQILLILVWTNTPSLDKSRKLAKKLSKLRPLWHHILVARIRKRGDFEGI